MSSEIDRDKIVERLNTLVRTESRDYLMPEGCLKFLKRAYKELGVDIEGTGKTILRDGRRFQKVDAPGFGVTVIFENVALFNDVDGRTYKFHVGLMLDDRWCIQSSPGTSGVGRIEITRHPFNISIRGFYKPVCFF